MMLSYRQAGWLAIATVILFVPDLLLWLVAFKQTSFLSMGMSVITNGLMVSAQILLWLTLKRWLLSLEHGAHAAKLISVIIVLEVISFVVDMLVTIQPDLFQTMGLFVGLLAIPVGVVYILFGWRLKTLLRHQQNWVWGKRFAWLVIINGVLFCTLFLAYALFITVPVTQLLMAALFWAIARQQTAAEA